MQSEPIEQAVVLAPAEDARLVLGRRIRGMLIFVPCAVVLTLSAWLTPSTAGYGTHRKLGLPQCGFISQTGYPCPSCGMTTAFADMAHGRVGDALWAQPFGAMLFLAVAGLAAVGLAELLTGRDFLRYLRPGVWWVFAALAGLLSGWGIKIACGISDGTLPVR
jgi:hypothetical protein